jgi:hypothetical protein
MASIHPGITGRGELAPLAVTIPKACEISGFGPTSIWAFLKDGRLKAVRVPGVRRTLVSYPIEANHCVCRRSCRRGFAEL